MRPMMSNYVAQDAEIARKRYKEDAARVARRELVDGQRRQTEQVVA